MKILNFGSCNIDKVYQVERIAKEGETISSYEMNTFPGGKGLNQSVALARAGALVYHAGAIGNDGGFLKNILIENNVDVTYLQECDNSTGHAIIQVDKFAENSILLFGGTNMEISCENIDNVINQFDSNTILVLQNEVSNVDYMVDKASEKGIKICLNPSPWNDDVLKIDFNKISYLILNETEAYSFSGLQDENDFFEFVKSKYPNMHVILTLGKKGSVYCYKEEKYYQSIFDAHAVDTTAAGDTFTGFFIAEIAKGTSAEDAMKIASAASAISVSRHGASSSIPTRNEVLKIIK